MKHFEVGRLSDEELSDLVESRPPFFIGEDFALFELDDGCCAVAPVSLIYDRAVTEAGFATEEHRQVIEKLVEYLHARMMQDGVRGFTQGEYEIMQRARELLA